MNFRKLPEECEDRAYWHKRFTFAAWLFLLMGIWAIFSSATPWSAMIGIGTSIFFKFIDGVGDARHMMWHIKRREDNDHV